MILNRTTKKFSVKTIKFLALLMVLIAAILLVTAYSSNASAWGNGQAKEGSLQGEIVSIDTVNHVETLTIVSGKIGSFPNDELNVFLNRDTAVKMCGKREPAKDLKTGFNAKIEYHELGGVPVADVISERC
jgi:hypothetical protein